jgi:glucosyl-3-phosphoglycerate synthase
MAIEERRVLVAGTSKEKIESLLPFARAFASPLGGNILVLGLVAVPTNVSLSTGALAARRLRQAIAPRARRMGARVVVRVAHDIWRELKQTVADEECALVLLNWEDAPPREWLRTLPCDVTIIKPPFPKRGCHILLPIRGGPYAALALRLALAIADAQQGEITVLHATPPSRRGVEYEQLVQHLRTLPRVTNWMNVSGDAVEAIITATHSHQLVLMGAIAKPRSGDPPIGPTATRVLSESQIPAIVVKAAPTKFMQEPERVDFTISVVVDKWFAENTFHAHEFQDLKHLVKLKEQQGLTISLGLPALDEEKTIGKIIRTVRAQFMQRYPLLDEIVVIDSNSTDRTFEIAHDLGVPVYRHSEILPEQGAYAGKGEALWKSLFVLKGDIIAWIDTDIVNIHPRFVYGILGPLIREPRLMFVKGFYQRPLRIGRKLEARGGGRVTELAARPLLNLFYPELSGFVQPLAGEYAGRRKALESVPFFVGYGVEMGLLIDLWSRFGLNAMGQVDLEERVHRNQSLMALSKMAFEIIQVVMQRVGTARGVELIDDLHRSMKLIRHARDEFQLEVADIRARERPPMISIAKYRALRGEADAPCPEEAAQ